MYLSCSLLCTRLASFWKCFHLYHLSPGRRLTGLQTMDYYSIRVWCEFVDPNSGCQPCKANTLPNIPSYIQCLFKTGVIHILPGPQFSWFLLSEHFLLLLFNQSKDFSLSAKRIPSFYMPMYFLHFKYIFNYSEPQMRMFHIYNSISLMWLCDRLFDVSHRGQQNVSSEKPSQTFHYFRYILSSHLT